MGQQDNKPNNETTVDGKPLFNQPRGSQIGGKTISKTEEYINPSTRDDDPILSVSERGNTRGDLLNEKLDENAKGVSHPIQSPK